VKVRFWGTRGSFAMSGAEFLRYGGNTTAVEVMNAAGQRLLVDLGTGATELAKELMSSEFGAGGGELPILLSHTHLDHIQGLPFFTPFFIKGNRIRIFGPSLMGMSLAQTLQNQLNPHYSPLYGLENLAAGVKIESIEPGVDFNVSGFHIVALPVPHGSMWTLAFRIEADDQVVTFLSDVEYPSGPTPEALKVAQGADLLIHDAMFSDEEYVHRHGWGHSPVKAAIEVAQRANAKRLALFHHSPDATDRHIDVLVDQARAATDIPLFAAAEGEYVDV
jgi:phosphoribosyl 1,2-cyclic phosphodiesterase